MKHRLSMKSNLESPFLGREPCSGPKWFQLLNQNEESELVKHPHFRRVKLSQQSIKRQTSTVETKECVLLKITCETSIAVVFLFQSWCWRNYREPCFSLEKFSIEERRNLIRGFLYMPVEVMSVAVRVTPSFKRNNSMTRAIL